MALRASSLPADIIQDKILMRAGVKLLVRFRSVCKHWNSLFYDLEFIRKLFNHTSTSSCISPKEDDDDYLLLFDGLYHRCLSILSRSNLSQSPISKLPSINQIVVVGSINGLVCLVDIKSYHFILWNPAIHWVKKISIPNDQHETMPSGNDVYKLFGFGWNSSTNDYILVAQPKVIAPWTIVYSCKTNTYQQVELRFYPYWWTPSVIVRGVPYWKSVSQDRVLKFDVKINEFKLLKAPCVDNGHGYSLINLNDRLALVDNDLSFKIGGCVHRFDEQDSTWSKIYTISTNLYDPKSFMFGGEIVFNGIDYLYDPKSDEIKSLVGCSYSKTKWIDGFSYTPTMLTLTGMKPLRSFDDGLASCLAEIQ